MKVMKRSAPGRDRAAAVLCAGLMVVAAGGCHKKADELARPDPARSVASSDAPPLSPVRFQKVQTRALPQTIEMSGTLAADETSEAATQVAGLVTKVNVDVGTRVKKGDVMVQLDPREAALKSAQASATSEQARARLGLGPKDKFDPLAVPDVRAAKEALDLAVADEQRAKVVFDSGSSSQAAWDQARIHADQTRAQYDVAVASVKQAWATLLGAQAAAGLATKSAGDTAIRAPFDGSIAEKRVSPGEYATVGKVVAVVVRDNPLRLKLDVAEADISKVREGSAVELIVSAFPQRTFQGVVKRIGASLRAASRTLPIEAEVPNGDGLLRSGLFARARLTVPGTPGKAVMVPAEAIGNTGSNSRVFVRQGTHVVERLVVPGRRLDGLTEIVGSVGEADEVAVTNVDRLSDGAEVSVAP